MYSKDKIIPYGKHQIKQNDIDAVVQVLQSDFLTQGPTVPQFENLLAQYCKVNHAVATNSATSSLHLACLALGVSRGDIVWTSAITFVASANCALYCNATIDFIDIDPLSYNMSVSALATKLHIAEQNNKLPKVVIPVHLCGQSCEMEQIHQLSKKYGFKIIEDASHAIGGYYQNNPIGNCRYSDITIFSFHPVKIITTGEGGIAVSNSEDLIKTMKLLRSHGVTNIKEDMHSRPSEEIWNYQQIDLGFNYRMTDICAALGISQLQRLISYVSSRHRIAKRYNQLLAKLPITLPQQNSECYSSYHLYPIRLKLNEIKITHQQVFQDLITCGIRVNLHYIPIYRQPYFQKLNEDFAIGYCPEADNYFAEAISLPIFPTLTKQDQQTVVRKLADIIC